MDSPRKQTRAGLAGAAALLWLLSGAAPAAADPPWETRDDIICRAASGVGFSYWWGGECWRRNGCSPDYSGGTGTCHGSGCPSDCWHSGAYGADCSGYVTKVWQVPNPIAVSACHVFRYVASSFTSSTSYWSVIGHGSLQRGDSLASSTHVLLYHHGDPWGYAMVYEAKGCIYGIVHNNKYIGSYVAARRINISDCQCTPGQTQTEGCGNCGHRSRTCQANCHWGSWSACLGQGPCSPGHTQTRDCCDCGTQSRSCNSSCQWGDWSACAGPDPGGGNVVCDTGEPGPCAEGRLRCIQGCLECRRIYEPQPELCDEIDNDCNGLVNDGNPTEMGDPPPRYAARLLDGSYPLSLAPGEQATGWVAFTNVGRETWTAGDVWLAAEEATEGRGSRLAAVERWPAHDVVAVLDRDVAPGDAATFRLTIQAPPEPGARVTESFRLAAPDGALMGCPEPNITVAVMVGRAAGPPAPPAEETAAPAELPGAAGGCSTGPGAPLPLWLLLGAAGFLIRRKRRQWG